MNAKLWAGFIAGWVFVGVLFGGCVVNKVRNWMEPAPAPAVSPQLAQFPAFLPSSAPPPPPSSTLVIPKHGFMGFAGLQGLDGGGFQGADIQGGGLGGGFAGGSGGPGGPLPPPGMPGSGIGGFQGGFDAGFNGGKPPNVIVNLPPMDRPREQPGSSSAVYGAAAVVLVIVLAILACRFRREIAALLPRMASNEE